MECDECKRGIHRHMDAKTADWYKTLVPIADRLDAIDCKNLVSDGQCVCHLWKEEYKRLVG